MHRRPDGKLIVSATDLVGFLECGHLTQLDRAAAAGLVSKPDRKDDPEVELLRRRGGEHEKRYLDQLRARGRTITSLDVAEGEWTAYETRAAQTITAMERGDDVIFQATVFDGRWVGHPDFLLRVPGASRLGDYHYEVADTKLAHSAKASALIQICSYVEQVERIQDVRPECVYVVTGGAELVEHAFRTADMMAYYHHAKQRFEDALDEALVGPRTWPIPRDESYPDPVDHCAVCRWYPHNCGVQWRDDDALKLVAGISRAQRQELGGLGIDTRGALAIATVDPKLHKVREQARLQVATGDSMVPAFELLEPEKDAQGSWMADLGLSALPKPDAGDLYFDMEGDPFAFWEGLEYLFGVWETPTGAGLWDQDGYRGVWALDRAQGRRLSSR